MKIPHPSLRIAICGVGQMGTGLVSCFKRAGYRVLAWDHDPEKLSTLERRVSKLDSWLDQNIGSPSNVSGAFQSVENLNLLDEEAEVVIECIVEDLAEKVNLFRRFTHSRERRAIFLTSTSGLSITEIGQRSGCDQLLAGTHFWNPPYLMPLVEVIRGQNTPSEVIDRTCRLLESIGKLAVRVNQDVPGFIGNRLVHALWREAIHMVENGIATAEDVDLVAKLTLGLRLSVVGPLENIDLVGADLVEKIHSYLLADLACNSGPSESIKNRVEEGRLGAKSGEGFYDWRSRNADDFIQERDLHIVRQLNFVKKLLMKKPGTFGELES
jgi:3-hydroxybutyryl-CoA dehydrogenase